MIKKVPGIYPNEVVYSWIARSYSQSGFLFNKYYLKEIFMNPKEQVDYNFINIFNSSFKRIIKETIGFKSLLLDHTLFKHYARFMSPEERKEVYKIGIHNSGLLNKKVHIPPSKKNYFLRYCPCCVKEDREKYGECYFHTEHQIYEINICPIHKVKLNETTIKNDKDSALSLITLEQLNPIISEIVKVPDDINYKVMNYIYMVFKEDLDIENDTLISDYLTSKLNRAQCVDNNCTKKNIIKLSRDISLFYKDLVIKNIKQHRICDVYRGQNINPYDILLLCYFHNLTPKEISKMELKKEDIKRPIMRRVYDLYKAGKDIDEISNEVGRKKTQVNRIILGYLKIKKCKIN